MSAALAMLPQGAAAQDKTKPPAAKAQNPAAGGASPSKPVVPSAENIVILIRSTLLSLNDALRTGNFTVLRDLAAPSFREANSAGRLYQIFSNLSAKRIDLSAVAILVPELIQPPILDQSRRLHIRGTFPGQPVQIDFEMLFEAVRGRWRLFSISVNPAPSTRGDGPPKASAVPAPERALRPAGKARRQK